METEIVIVDKDQHPLRSGALEIGRFYRISSCPENPRFEGALVCRVADGLISMWYQVNDGNMYSIGDVNLFEKCTFTQAKAVAIKFPF